ncbi:hypothetical protein X745_28195 [Mesorhizobium sp. LNJC374B00]|nr:hypothetical protein X745_28195 [Mesorhizobium sp. LNJC374B00]
MAWLVTATLKKWLVCSPIRKDEGVVQPAKWPTSPAKGGKQA